MIRLFEGSGAKDAALKAASEVGMFYPEVGSGGLKREEVLEVVRWMETPLGREHAIVLGPMDQVRQGSSDALLKIIEEPPVAGIHLFMHCEDASQVSPTILSRVQVEFVASADSTEYDFSEIWASYMKQDSSFFGTLQQWKGQERELLRGMVSGIDPTDFESLKKWERLRELTTCSILTPSMMVAAWFD